MVNLEREKTHQGKKRLKNGENEKKKTDKNGGYEASDLD